MLDGLGIVLRRIGPGLQHIKDEKVDPGLPASIDSWSLTNLQQRLVKTGGHLIKHGRYWWLPAESDVTRRSFGACC